MPNNFFLYLKSKNTINEIKKSGVFDEEYYINRYGLKKYKRFPIFHYLLEGEKRGYSVSEQFDSGYYQECYPEVSAMGALLHYIRHGQFEDRVTARKGNNAVESYEELESQLPILNSFGKNKSKVAVVCHMFYSDLWDEFSEQISNIPESFDLYVSIVNHHLEGDLESRILSDFPDAYIKFFPNHGRDIFSFIEFVNAGLLDGYDAVCKLHTKKSPHREDGSKWRQHLVGQILHDEQTIEKIIRNIRENNAGIVVADGQIFEGQQWQGSNQDILEQLSQRIQMNLKRIPIRFAGGSIFWISGDVLSTIKRFNLSLRDYPQEYGQIDGTTHHAMERMFSYLCHEGGYEIKQVAEMEDIESVESKTKPLFLSFYLPQYHPIPENDKWWGKGFTEWRNVTKAQPLFESHYQPRYPADLGYYDLRLPEIQEAQSEMALEYGIDAFCYYYYWFDGKKVLHKPMENMLSNPDINIPFCICWANENWTRTWDGLDHDILLGQSYDEGFAESIFQDMLPALSDVRYFKHQDKLLLIIYRPNKIERFYEATQTWRTLAKQNGLGELHIAGVNFHLDDEQELSLEQLGLDSTIVFPPHGLVNEDNFILPQTLDENVRPNINNVRHDFQGLIYDYQSMMHNEIENAETSTEPDGKVHRGITLGWDNTARKNLNAHISYGCNPLAFRKWLKTIIDSESKKQTEDYLVFINAWNEWAEGTYLEPDEKYGFDYLNAVKKIKWKSKNNAN